MEDGKDQPRGSAARDVGTAFTQDGGGKNREARKGLGGEEESAPANAGRRK